MIEVDHIWYVRNIYKIRKNMWYNRNESTKEDENRSKIQT